MLAQEERQSQRQAEGYRAPVTVLTCLGTGCRDEQKPVDGASAYDNAQPDACSQAGQLKTTISDDTNYKT